MTFSDHIVALQKQKGKTLLPELIIEMVDWARNLQLKNVTIKDAPSRPTFQYENCILRGQAPPFAKNARVHASRPKNMNMWG